MEDLTTSMREGADGPAADETLVDLAVSAAWGGEAETSVGPLEVPATGGTRSEMARPVLLGLRRTVP